MSVAIGGGTLPGKDRTSLPEELYDANHKNGSMGKYDSFLEELSSRLSQRGLLVKRGMGLDPYQLDILAIANAYEASKFGKMTRFITAASMDNVEINTVKDFSSRATQFSLDNRESLLPRGFGGTLLSVPTIVSMNFSDDVKDWIGKNRPPKHFAAFEFPVLVSTADRQIYYYQKTPFGERRITRDFENL